MAIQDFLGSLNLDGRHIRVPQRAGSSSAMNDAKEYRGVIYDYMVPGASGIPFIYADTGSTTRTDASLSGGVTLFTNSATDNDEMISHTGWVFLFARGKPIVWGGRAAIVEANTDDSNFLIGLVSGAATSFLGDNGGGPPSSYSGMNFHKVDGGTVWIAEQSQGSSQNTDTDCGTRVSGTYVNFDGEVYDHPTDVTKLRCDFYIDGSQVHTCDFTISSPAQMAFVHMIKNGGGNAETMNVDYVYCLQPK